MSVDRFQLRDLSWFHRMMRLHSFPRRIDSIHLHHTWIPRRSDFEGQRTILGMWRHHTEENGWSDIAQHLTIDPKGGLWPGRPWDKPPASATGFNGNWDVGPFMIEMVGDFDTGREDLDGKQREAAVEVIATLMERAGLDLSALRFHRDMSSKTCPGSGVDREQLKKEIDAARKKIQRRTAKDAKPPFEVDIRSDYADVEALHADDRGSRSVEMGDEVACGWEGASLDAARADRGGKLNEKEKRELLPYVINLHQGRLSNRGGFRSWDRQVETIFKTHLMREARAAEAKPEGQRTLRVVFWAHGGLVSEEAALAYAHSTYSWWRANGIYPIYFVWETGLWETLRWMLFRRRRDIEVRGLKNDAIEAVGRKVGYKVWNSMKNSAAAADDPPPPGGDGDEGGGARFAAKHLGKLLTDVKKKHPEVGVEVHAVGHSAGAIFHSHFVPQAVDAKATLSSLQFLAPALRVDDYLRRLDPLVEKSVDEITLFTMDRAAEEADRAGPYTAGSLLYLVSRALEREKDAPLLGLQESLHSDSALRKRFGGPGEEGDGGEVVYSPTDADRGRDASAATSHGGFDNDPMTMNAVARRILGLDDSELLPESFPSRTDRGLGAGGDGLATGFDAEWDALWALLEESPTAAPSPPPPPSHTAPAVHVPTDHGGGQRRALCIGIDQYELEGDRLSGCVNDAETWAEHLGRIGFQASLVTDDNATRKGMLRAIADLLRPAQPGDILVFQCSGHGTQVEDLDGDEKDDRKDEALCPVDFRSGALLIDDDLRDALSKLPNGVSLTVFLDLCHSGTATRLAASRPPTGAGKARFVRADRALLEAHRTFRRSLDGSRDPQPGAPIRWVNFSACQPHELAYESYGQGDFTRVAAPLVGSLPTGTPHRELQRRIVEGFGPNPRQRPRLDPPEARDQGLFLPGSSATAATDTPGSWW